MSTEDQGQAPDPMILLEQYRVALADCMTLLQASHALLKEHRGFMDTLSHKVDLAIRAARSGKADKDSMMDKYIKANHFTRRR